MGDLARLGMRIESDEVATADKRLDDFVASAERAESAADDLASGSKRASSSLRDMEKSLQKDVAQMNALAAASDGTGTSFSRNSRQIKAHNDNMKLATHELTNLGRNFADVGVMLASGQNPFMTLLQQGPQIADVFHTASLRGVGFKAVLGEIMAMAAPFAAVLAPIVVAAGAMGVAFAVSAQQINKDNKGLINSLHLTQDQLENVKNKTVTMGDVMSGTWKAAAGALTKAFGPEIKATSKFFADLYQGTVDAAVRGVKIQVGSWVGGYDAIRATWRMLPAAMGDIAYSTANVVIRAVERSVNAAIDLINGLVDRANEVTTKIGLPKLGRLDSVAFSDLGNPYAGAAAKAGEAAGKAYAAGVTRGASYVDAAMAAIESETLKAYRARVLKEAGKAGKGSTKKDPLEESELSKSVKMFQWASAARGQAMDEEWKRVERLKDANTKLIEEHDRQVEQARRALRDDGYGVAVGAIRSVRGTSKDAGLERRQATFDQIAEFERLGVVSHRDAEAAKAAIDRQYAQERLQVASDFFGNLASLSAVKNKELAAIGKAAAIVQATIDGVLAVQKALAAYPPPVNFAMAAAVGTVAAVNVAKIAGFKDGGWTGNGATDQISGVTHGQEFVVKAGPAAANRSTLEAMNAGRQPPAPTPRPETRPANDSRPVIIQQFSLGNGNLVTEKVYADMDRKAQAAAAAAHASAVRTAYDQAPQAVARYQRQKG